MKIPVTKVTDDDWVLYQDIISLLSDLKLIKGGFYVEKFLQNNPNIKNYLEECINHDILSLENSIRSQRG